ncbi:MAG: enoyl-ACP reductase [Planctomycetota bacterium]
MKIVDALSGRKGLVLGVANNRSIAWGIAQSLRDSGAELGFTYQGDKLKGRVEPLAEELGVKLLLPCDVTNPDEVETLFARVKDEWGKLDFLVHSLAFAPKEELEGQYLKTSRNGFLMAHDISAYSLTALAQQALPLMSDGGSIVALTYLGGERVVPGYNVMGVAKASLEMSVQYLAHDLGPQGVRVNAISAGPVNTLAARGVSGFTKMMDIVGDRAPLKRNVTLEEIGCTASFLISPLSSGITGEVIHVDAGFHVLGM